MKRVERNACWIMMVVVMAATGCVHGNRGRPSPLDETMRLAQESAQAAFAAGAYEEAEERFTVAINRAFLRDDGQAVARYRYQIAACRIAQGRLAEGKGLLETARAEALVAGDGLAAARAETAAARVALELGDLPESQRLARSALSRPEAGASLRLSADARLVLAEAAIRGGDPAQAKAELAESGRGWTREPVDPAIQAVTERVRGQIAESSGDAKEAGQAFDREAVQWSQIRRFAENAASLERAALAWQKAGEGAGAANRMYRAARIRAALGHTDKAMRLAGLAVDWAGKDELFDLQACAQALAREMEEHTRSKNTCIPVP